MVEILKSYGIYYIEIDYTNKTQKEYIKGSLEDVMNALKEIMAKGLLNTLNI